MMDDLKYICMKIDNCEKSKLCFKNKVICTRRVLERYIDGNRDKILVLRAELNRFEKPKEREVSYISVTLSFCTLVTTMIYSGLTQDETRGAIYWLYILFVLLALFVFGVNIKILQKNESIINKWKEYILVVLDDMEKEYESSNK